MPAIQRAPVPCAISGYIECVGANPNAVRLGPDLRTVVVGTPAYFARPPRPETPADLDAHNCVNYRLVGGGGLLPWEFARDGQEVRVRAKGQLIVNDADLSGAAVRAGAVHVGFVEGIDDVADLDTLVVARDELVVVVVAQRLQPDEAAGERDGADLGGGRGGGVRGGHA